MIFLTALQIYLSVLAGADSPAREAAIDSLTNSRDVAMIAGAMSRVNWRVRAGLFDALERIGERAVDSLISVSKHHKKVDAQRLAIRSLGRVGGTAARDYLLTLKDSPHRDLVARGLGDIGDPVALPLLRAFLKDDHPDVRRRAVLALGSFSDACDIGRLVCPMLNDRHHGVRSAAVDVLFDMGNAAGEIAMMQWAGFGFSGKIAAIALWKRLRFEPALPILVQLLKNRDWALRASAVDALEALRNTRMHLVDAQKRERHPFVKAKLDAVIDMLDSP